MFRRQAIVDRDDEGSQLGCKAPVLCIIHLRLAHDECAAVDVDDHRRLGAVVGAIG